MVVFFELLFKYQLLINLEIFGTAAHDKGSIRLGAIGILTFTKS